MDSKHRLFIMGCEMLANIKILKRSKLNLKSHYFIYDIEEINTDIIFRKSRFTCLVPEKQESAEKIALISAT